MILAYAFDDDPGYEHELEVDSVAEARAFVASREGMLWWVKLTDDAGENITHLLG